ncbi:DUF2723 domain-containing protein [Cytophagaceae bacterium ABcell3]|nr:DUF2723 domain-containing protein [Cytophagaceae bacterium ABcell3]
MLEYQKLNNITGWIVFLFAAIVYTLTVEPTASFWDAGEFIAAAYKLQVPHPPGAPLYLLIGRFFSLFTSDLEKVALYINMVSVITSAATILFLFWTITMLAKKLVLTNNETPSLGQQIAILGSGAVGALAFTFSDSFWFSAVEAEVYAMSSFFTALVFWAILKWESRADEPGSDRWLIFIGYAVGLSIGVHLLNLLAIPAIAFVYYFKKYKVSKQGVVLTFVVGAVIIGVIMSGIIVGLPSLAGSFELFFVNTLGTPFGTGIIIFSIIFIALLTYGIIYSNKHEKRVLNTVLLTFTFIVIGYASYGIIPIRSNYNPPIDENNPENILSFVSYLKREQYGDRPLIKGPLFTAGYPDVKRGAPLYRKDSEKGRYVIYDYRREYIYDKEHMVLFPRMYSTQSHHVEAYKERANLAPGQRPTTADNISYFLNYQLYHMYLRYLLWNFAGRESDIQDADWLGPTDWFEKDLPHYLEVNKARNNFFMIPLILGLIGLVFHYTRHNKDANVVMLFFFFTGIAIIIYLNQPPVEPRERDYTFAGSFYAFSIWIGLGVLALREWIGKLLKAPVIASSLALVIGLTAPGIMMAEGWDDHDRSNRWHSVDSAKNLLNSCAPNAILFTGGDNDTFPLWYVQEVEGFRTDVRVCNLSLLNTDWYINQMKRDVYESEALPISLEFEDYIQGTNDALYFQEVDRFKDRGISLPGYINLVKQRNSLVMAQTRSGDAVTTFPSRKFFLPVSKDAAAQAVPEDLRDFIVDRMTWSINQSTLEKKDLIMLDMISTNNWERPIYFSTTLSQANFLNLKEYTQLEGMAHRLLPAKLPGASQGWINTEIMHDNLMNNFHYRELDNPDVYYDENHLRFPLNLRTQFQRLAGQLELEDNKEQALEVINHCFAVMPDTSIPYDVSIPPFVPILLKLGERDKAIEITETMGDRAVENLAYLERKNTPYTNRDYYLNLHVLNTLITGLRNHGETDLAARYDETFRRYERMLGR